MPQVHLTRGRLKGPAGSVTTDKRVVVSKVNLHGPVDKRVLVSKVTLVAPPPNARVRITSVRLVGPNAPARAAYIGTVNGWVPVDVYLPGTNGVWQKIT